MIWLYIALDIAYIGVYLNHIVFSIARTASKFKPLEFEDQQVCMFRDTLSYSSLYQVSLERDTFIIPPDLVFPCACGTRVKFFAHRGLMVLAHVLLDNSEISILLQNQ